MSERESGGDRLQLKQRCVAVSRPYVCHVLTYDFVLSLLTVSPRIAPSALCLSVPVRACPCLRACV